MPGPSTPRQEAFDSENQWTINEHGIWCNSCGECICPGWLMDNEDEDFDDYCKTCGYPEMDEVAIYHCGDE